MQQSVRIAPLVEDGQVVGTLTVIEDVTERVIYDAESAARARQQAAISELSQYALSASQSASLLQLGAALVAETLDVDYSAIFTRAGCDAASMILQADWPDGRNERRPVEAGAGSLASHVLRAGGPVVMANLAAETRFRIPPLLSEQGVLSGVALPFVGGDRPLGILGVFARQARVFTDDQILFLQVVANVIGVALERNDWRANCAAMPSGSSKRTGARTNSWPCWRTNCATRSRRFATPFNSCA